jgi:hypothetical protein
MLNVDLDLDVDLWWCSLTIYFIYLFFQDVHKVLNKITSSLQWRMKHYEWQEMVKFEIFPKLQVTCNEEWNIMDDKEWSNPEYSVNYK